MKVAIIPARGGSKRIPGKNIRDFAGQPIIKYPIKVALACGLFDRVLVSTDAEDIADVAEAAGAECPFRRPPELADDYTLTLPVIRHALAWLADNDDRLVEHVCCIFPTAPFVQPQYIREGYELLAADPEAEFALAVTSFGFPIQRALKIKDGHVAMFWPEHELTRSQDLTEAFQDAGQFVWGRVDAFQKYDGVYRARTRPVLLPRYLVQDIDTPEDWELAERMFLALPSQES